MDNPVELTKLITHINIEMSGETKRYLVSAKQGDKATRYIVAKLLNNGEEYIIPAGARAAINIEKPDGKHIYNSCEYESSTVLVKLTSQALAAAGTAYCDIEIRTSDDTQVITSASFTIEIEAAIRKEGAIQSTNEFTEIEKRIASHITNISETEAAVRTAEAERVSAENVREENENIRIEQENQRQEETEKAVNGAEEAAEAAKTATEDCINMMNSSSETVKAQIETIKEAGSSAVKKINDAVELVTPRFLIDYETGDLLYVGGRYVFNLNEDGDLEWRLSV